MSETLDALRSEVDALEVALDTARIEQRELEAELQALPAPDILKRHTLPNAWRFALLSVLAGWALAFGAATAYDLNWRPKDRFQGHAEIALKNNIEMLRRKAEEGGIPNDMQAIIDVEVSTRLDAIYPAPSGQSPDDEGIYRAVRVSGREGAAEVALRWTNIGLAACEVREKSLALHATKVLSWLNTPRDQDGRAARFLEAKRRDLRKPDGTAHRLRTQVITACMHNQVSLLGELFEATRPR